MKDPCSECTEKSPMCELGCERYQAYSEKEGERKAKLTVNFRRHYNARKENGLCVRCGNPVDEDRKAHCADCIAHNGEEAKEARAYYIEHGICPICKKNDLLGKRRSCFECSEKRKAAEKKKREKISEWRRNTYENRMASGMCHVCGTKKPDPGYVTCSTCRIKRKRMRIRKILRDRTDVLRNERVDYNRCYRCGAEGLYNGTRLCEKCYDTSVNISLKAAQEANLARKYSGKQKLIISPYAHIPWKPRRSTDEITDDD